MNLKIDNGRPLPGGVRAQRRSPEPEPADRFSPSPASWTPPAKPQLQPKSSGPITRGYMWEGAAIGGCVGAVLTRVLTWGPLPRWIGLEPAPVREPELKPLAFGWNELPADQFAARMRELEQQLDGGVEAGKAYLGKPGKGCYLVELDTGPVTVWKPKAQQRPEKDRVQMGRVHQGKRERAAYLVDRFLGHLARVAPATENGLAGRAGTLALFVPEGTPAANTAAGKKATLESLRPEDYRRIALFDHIIGNLDRHGGNWLVDTAGRPIPIDHGLAFPASNGSQGFANFDFGKDFELNSTEKQLLQRFCLQRKQIDKELSPVLERRAIEAMFERVERMLQRGATDSWWRQP
jgi:hypothetical protein